MIKEWNPQTWSLSAPVEIWINKKATIAQFADTLSTTLGIPVENLVCTKINSPWNFHRIQLPFIQEIKLDDPAVSSSFLTSSPFYLSTDGILFIVRNNQNALRDMTPEEKDLYRCEEFENQMFSGAVAGGGFRKVVNKEAAVKITVKAKGTQEEKEKE